MFQQSDDFNIDEDFFNDAFDSIENNDNRPMKKLRGSSPETPDRNVLNLFTNETRKESSSNDNRSQSVLNLFTDNKNVKSTEKTVTAQESNENQVTTKCANHLLDVFVDELVPDKPFNNNNTKTITFKSPAISRKVVKRKFPGPAGILPDQPVNINLKVLENCDNSINNKTEVSDEMLCSQSYVNCFKEGLWLVMLKDYYSNELKYALPEKYSISWLKAKANARLLLGQKTPFLAAIIHSIEFNGNFPIAILKDPTGEIPATICNEVWNEYAEKLHVGSVIALRQVGVLTTHKKHYLNITLNNIITIYSHRNHIDDVCTQKNYESEVIQLENVTCSDIVRNIEETKVRYKNRQNVTVTVENDNPFFGKPSNRPVGQNGELRRNGNDLGRNGDLRRNVVTPRKIDEINPNKIVKQNQNISKFFNVDDKNKSFVTSTQTDNVVGGDNKFVEELDGLEESFFDEF